MSQDETKKEPGKAGGKDLDDLKARLGLKKPAAGGPGAPAAAPRKAGAEDFKFSFGAQEKPSLSAAELAAIDAEAQKASRPIGRYIILGVVGVVVVALLLWLGYQFGNSMGMRVIHNAAVEQARDVKEFFLKKYMNMSGNEIDPRRDVTVRFVEEFSTFHEEQIISWTALAKILSDGKLPPEFDIAQLKADNVAKLKKMCKDYLTTIEEFSVAGILKGQLYSTELGAKLLDHTERANRLRNRVENLFFALELLDEYLQGAELPKDLKPEVLVHSFKAEGEQEQVPTIEVVEITGTPEADKELTTKELCEPIAIELEIPICNVKKGEPEYEKRLIDTYEKRESQEIKHFRKVKAKASDGRALTARLDNLYKMDLRPYLMPLIDWIKVDREVSLKNLSLLVGAVVQNMNDVRQAGEAVDFTDLLDSVEKLASLEAFFTL